MIGDVKSKGTIVGTLTPKASVVGTVESSSILADAILARIHMVRIELPNYEGEYEAIPSLEVQTFPTKDTSMREDFVVREIPYYETSNPSGGYTAIIGG